MKNAIYRDEFDLYALIERFTEERKKYKESLVFDSLGSLNQYSCFTGGRRYYESDKDLKKYIFETENKSPSDHVVYNILLEASGEKRISDSHRFGFEVGDKIVSRHGHKDITSMPHFRHQYFIDFGVMGDYEIKKKPEDIKITVKLGNDMPLIKPLRSEPFSDIEISVCIFMITNLENSLFYLFPRQCSRNGRMFDMVTLGYRLLSWPDIYFLLRFFPNTVLLNCLAPFIGTDTMMSIGEYNRLKNLICESNKIYVETTKKLMKYLEIDGKRRNFHE